jgi:pilus assembly protein TadC
MAEGDIPPRKAISQTLLFCSVHISSIRLIIASFKFIFPYLPFVEFHNYYKEIEKNYLVEFHDIDKVLNKMYNILEIVKFHDV